MSRPARLAEQICERARDLPQESLVELAAFVDYLHFRINARDLREEQLAREYDALASMYGELCDELEDEVWLPLENEALLKAERDIES